MNNSCFWVSFCSSIYFPVFPKFLSVPALQTRRRCSSRKFRLNLHNPLRKRLFPGALSAGANSREGRVRRSLSPQNRPRESCDNHAGAASPASAEEDAPKDTGPGPRRRPRVPCASLLHPDPGRRSWRGRTAPPPETPRGNRPHRPHLAVVLSHLVLCFGCPNQRTHPPSLWASGERGARSLRDAIRSQGGP